MKEKRKMVVSDGGVIERRDYVGHIFILICLFFIVVLLILGALAIFHT